MSIVGSAHSTISGDARWLEEFRWHSFEAEPDWPELTELPKDANVMLIERSERHLVYTAWQKSFWAPQIIHFLARAHPQLEFWYNFHFEEIYGWGRAKGRDVFYNQFDAAGQDPHWLGVELWDYGPRCDLGRSSGSSNRTISNNLRK
ncbi:MAG: hypothetical protein KME03_02980 [Aphanocapsa lilacina HA4352-LM1]|jgi:hypothetical protein|nr:hypothetical protein [Aphanocapsa lilacina HA4352-LM1]